MKQHYLKTFLLGAAITVAALNVTLSISLAAEQDEPKKNGVPPGLQKKGGLPPGQAKKYYRATDGVVVLKSRKSIFISALVMPAGAR